MGRIYENGSLYAELQRQADDLRREVAERRQAERQTERIFETSQDLIHVNDSYGNFVRSQPQHDGGAGFPAGGTARPRRQRIHPSRRPRSDPPRDAGGAARPGGRRFRCRYYHKDGHWLSLLWSGVWSEPRPHTISSAAT